VTVLHYVGSFFLLVGAFFTFVGALGVLRMPDVYNKLQAGTKATTLGFLSLAVGLIFLQPSWALRALLVAFFVLLTNPVGSHALARAAKNTSVPAVSGRAAAGMRASGGGAARAGRKPSSGAAEEEES
jgi:multicomponent Na+:H+ antiporter subunit G